MFKLSINLPKPGYIYNLFNNFKYKWLVNAHVVNKFKVSLVYSGCEFDNSLTWQQCKNNMYMYNVLDTTFVSCLKEVYGFLQSSVITTITNQRLPGACNRSPGSKLLSITTQLHCGGHLGGRAWLPDTKLEEDHPMTIPSKFGFNWATGSRRDGFYVNFP